jgi:hypothetical protein
VFVFTGCGYRGFSHRWLVSLTGGGDISRTSMQAVKAVVESRLWYLNEERVTELVERLFSLCLFPEKESCSLTSV